MKHFRFSLQSLQTLRRQQEEKALECYGQALRLRESAAQSLARAEASQAQARSDWLRQVAQGCSAAQLTHWQWHAEELVRQVQAARAALANAEQEAARLFKAFLAARQAREIVDKCHDQRWQHYQHDLRRDEQQALDEIGLRARGLAHPTLLS